MNNAVLGVPLIRYATVNKLMSGKDSLDCSYDEGIKGLSQTSWDAPDVAGGGRSCWHGNIVWGLHPDVRYFNM